MGEDGLLVALNGEGNFIRLARFSWSEATSSCPIGHLDVALGGGWGGVLGGGGRGVGVLINVFLLRLGFDRGLSVVTVYGGRSRF
jgi:hypothetical protein